MTRIILTLATVLALTACGTVEGAGQDLQSAGQAISSAARQTQSSM